ncbi:uncharacterized protein K452DRAFT_287042 [Aplosporella prunicola CBS 121167]|uniref:Myb-like domain-containing protein n=1 Tax=Aplosporella prunicola CBS 121167 TaxID=1176127 RepID=A0A6A6BH85_9PEZI|nr:uncharacterized protein K452DRAFT_287042 [Aplosporella prunicola CBS 121167]KAF2142624.1 hypothetical protein K452DRAFT_287042 [Aplosporella prunicola CBS 121167]
MDNFGLENAVFWWTDPEPPYAYDVPGEHDPTEFPLFDLPPLDAAEEELFPGMGEPAPEPSPSTSLDNGEGDEDGDEDGEDSGERGVGGPIVISSDDGDEMSNDNNDDDDSYSELGAPTTTTSVTDISSANANNTALSASAPVTTAAAAAMSAPPRPSLIQEKADAAQDNKTGRRNPDWNAYERESCAAAMRQSLRDTPVLQTVERWDDVRAILASQFNINRRTASGVKNYWNRNGRVESGVDERKRPRAQAMRTTLCGEDKKEEQKAQRAAAAAAAAAAAVASSKDPGSKHSVRRARRAGDDDDFGFVGESLALKSSAAVQALKAAAAYPVPGDGKPLYRKDCHHYNRFLPTTGGKEHPGAAKTHLSMAGGKRLLSIGRKSIPSTGEEDLPGLGGKGLKLRKRGASYDDDGDDDEDTNSGNSHVSKKAKLDTEAYQARAETSGEHSEGYAEVHEYGDEEEQGDEDYETIEGYEDDKENYEQDDQPEEEEEEQQLEEEESTNPEQGKAEKQVQEEKDHALALELNSECSYNMRSSRRSYG